MSDAQKHYETERLLEYRCLRCGSGDTYPADEVWVEESGDVGYIGIACRDCGYWDDFSGATSHPQPFILPGDPGSHDKIADYDPVSA